MIYYIYDELGMIRQLKKGSIPNAMIWAGYSFSQIGLWMALK